MENAAKSEKGKVPETTPDQEILYSERKPGATPKDIAFKAPPRPELVRIFQLEADRRLAELGAVSCNRPDAENPRLEALDAKQCPEVVGSRAAVFGKLLVGISVGISCSSKGQTIGKMLERGRLEVELGGGLPVGSRVPRAEGDA